MLSEETVIKDLNPIFKQIRDNESGILNVARLNTEGLSILGETVAALLVRIEKLEEQARGG